LIRIYESEHDWPRAIEAVQNLRKLVNEPVPQIVHYHCEQAQAFLAQKPPNIEQARLALGLAQDALASAEFTEGTPAFVRVAMLNGSIAASLQDFALEQRYLESVLNQAPEFAGLVAADLFKNYSAQGLDVEGLSRLQAHYQQYPSLDLFNVVFRGLRAEQGVEQAWTFARLSLQSHPSLLGLDRLLEAELASSFDYPTYAASGSLRV
jgi:lipopolysaccharide biosynthesis regulator YciM